MSDFRDMRRKRQLLSEEDSIDILNESYCWHFGTIGRQRLSVCRPHQLCLSRAKTVFLHRKSKVLL